MNNKKDLKITHDEWLREMFPPQINDKPHNSFTIYDVMRATGLKRRTALYRINEKVSEGELLVVKVVINGHVSNCYIEAKKQLTSDSEKSKDTKNIDILKIKRNNKID